MADHLPIVDVAAGIICHGGRILACQRSYGDMKDGWEFPGGKVEPGETAREACVRELSEELGVAVEAGPAVRTVEWDYPDFHLHMTCFACTLAPGQKPRMLEHEAMRWLGWDDLDDIAWLPADEDLVSWLGDNWETLPL